MSKYQNILNEPNLLDLSKKIFNAALNIIEDTSIKEEIMLGYGKLKAKLGKPGVTDRASEDILDLLVQ